MIKIIKPSVDPYGHCGDTFRELVDLWEENNLCEIETKNTPYVWWGEIGDIILYDRPTLQWFNSNDKHKWILSGNTVPNGWTPWIFWGRRPRLMEKFISKRKNYNDRNIESLFLGKIENSVQQNKRTGVDWSKNVEIFEMPINGTYTYTQEQYLEMLTRSKYGLCLSGYGPKCNREIELLAMGVVPLITPLVDLTYYNRLEEGKHYIRVDQPEDIRHKIESISSDQWMYMSRSGIEWYDENCSTLGSFNTTLNIINEHCKG